MFCIKCGSLMMPKDGKMKCNCGYVKSEGKITDKKKKNVNIEIVEENSNNHVLPKIKYECKKCGYHEAYFWTVQTRSADEPETQFYKCVKCNNTHREY